MSVIQWEMGIPWIQESNWLYEKRKPIWYKQKKERAGMEPTRSGLKVGVGGLSFAYLRAIRRRKMMAIAPIPKSTAVAGSGMAATVMVKSSILPLIVPLLALPDPL